MYLKGKNLRLLQKEHIKNPNDISITKVPKKAIVTHIWLALSQDNILAKPPKNNLIYVITSNHYWNYTLTSHA